MSQGSSYPYCDITTDLQRAFNGVEEFNGLTSFTDFTLDSGSTYREEQTGYLGVVYEDSVALTAKTSIATVEATVSTYWYDDANDILYVHMSDGLAPSTHTVTGNTDDWDGLKTTFRNDAMEMMESMLDPKFPRPIPFARNSYNSDKYDFDIRYSCALLTVSLIVRYRQPDNPLADTLEKRIWDEENESGILYEHYKGGRAFSFETTKDEFKGNLEVVTLDATSTGRIFITGNPVDDSNRYTYRIKFNKAGVARTAQYTLSSDDGVSYAGTYDTSERFLYVINGIYIRCEGTFVLNDEWKLSIASGMEEVNSSIGNIDIEIY